MLILNHSKIEYYRTKQILIHYNEHLQLIPNIKTLKTKFILEAIKTERKKNTCQNALELNTSAKNVPQSAFTYFPNSLYDLLTQQNTKENTRLSSPRLITAPLPYEAGSLKQKSIVFDNFLTAPAHGYFPADILTLWSRMFIVSQGFRRHWNQGHFGNGMIIETKTMFCVQFLET